ncbi:hypothetical protein ACWDA7_28680 [Streptomyces sp. NPDC001156]
MIFAAANVTPRRGRTGFNKDLASKVAKQAVGAGATSCITALVSWDRAAQQGETILQRVRRPGWRHPPRVRDGRANRELRASGS